VHEPPLHIALYQPEVPPNTGNAGRLALALGLRLHVIHPIPFQMDEKAVRRAGLDYWKHVDLVEHATPDAFWAWAEGRRVHVFSARGAACYTRAEFQAGDVLLFGPESVGLPSEILDRFTAWRIPIPGPVRSLNLSNAVAIIAYRAMESIQPELFA
jgi:tRNA (cytidine/uridine-2'-O-)-methyltransferase